MTKTELLMCMKTVTEEAVSEMYLPTRMQRGDTEEVKRSPKVYLMRLPDGNKATTYAPYIIHTIVVGHDFQESAQRTRSVATVRSIFCVYSDDEQEGGLMLLEMMEKVRIDLMKRVSIGSQFSLVRDKAIDQLLYTDDTAPYFAGEMVTNWELPSVEREVALW